MDNKTQIVIGGNFVLIMWLFSAIVAFRTHDYQMMNLVTPIVALYATYLFGKPILDRKRNGNGNGGT